MNVQHAAKSAMAIAPYKVIGAGAGASVVGMAGSQMMRNGATDEDGYVDKPVLDKAGEVGMIFSVAPGILASRYMVKYVPLPPPGGSTARRVLGTALSWGAQLGTFAAIASVGLLGARAIDNRPWS